MKVFAISDLHLSTQVEKPMDIFGDGWQNHFEKISDDWEARVKDTDIVLLGGDISWGIKISEAKADYDLVDRLKGIKVIVKGNHDYYWSSLNKMQIAFPNFYFLQNNAYRFNAPMFENSNVEAANDNSLENILQNKTQYSIKQQKCNETNKDNIHSTTQNLSTTFNIDKITNGIVVCGSRGWNIPDDNSPEEDKKIYDHELLRLEMSLSSAKKLQQKGDIIIALLHYPPFNADFKNSAVTELLEKYGVSKVLYGHLHGKNVRVNPKIIKNKIEYILTSCDLIGNKLVEILNV